MEDFSRINRELELAKKEGSKGGEYWMGRDIQKILGYSTWENFQNIIEKASKTCEGVGEDPYNHFRAVTNMIKAGKGAMVQKADFFLTRYACYLVAMNGDPAKPEIGIAQTYFAVQTRRQELQDIKNIEYINKRIQARERVKNANIILASTAKKAGVQRYAFFQTAGYLGLYEMGLTEIKAKKGLKLKENLLDCVGHTELAANEFRITQTKDKLIRDGVNGEQAAIDTHRNVGSEIRNVIKKLGGTMPEDLPAEESIKKLTGKRDRKKSIKESPKLIN